MATLELKAPRRDTLTSELEPRLEPATVFRRTIEEPRAIAVKLHVTPVAVRSRAASTPLLPDADDGVMDTSEIFRISGRHQLRPIREVPDSATAPPPALPELGEMHSDLCGMTAEEVYPKTASVIEPARMLDTRPVLSTERTQRRASEPLSREGDEPLVVAGVGLVGAMVTLLVMLFLGYGAA